MAHLQIGKVVFISRECELLQ